MAIDRMDWHYGADDFPPELTPEAGGTHIGMFITWVICNDLEGELHKSESAESLRKVKDREMTGTEFLVKECDEKFWDDDLNTEGLEFANHYYVSNIYYSDYEKALLESEPSLYHIQDTWENFDKLSPLIDSAFKKWKAEKNRKWWQFWR